MMGAYDGDKEGGEGSEVDLLIMLWRLSGPNHR